MKLKVFFLTLFLALTNLTIAQVKFEAKISKKKLGVNERLRVDFEMNQDGDNFRQPSFRGFTVVGGPNQSISNSWVNGKRSYSKTYSYFLSPTKKGRFTIGQASIEIDGNVYKTVPVTVEVSAAVAKPKDPNDPTYKAQEGLHLVAEVSKGNPYLNEAITVVYKLYVAPGVQISDLRRKDEPTYSDFWSQNIDIKQLKVERGEYKGQPYNLIVCGKTVLYPQKTGKLNIEPLVLTVAVDVPSNRRDIFGGRLYTTVNRTVTAGKRTIDVKALPEIGKPASFSGAVGKFDFKVNTNKTELGASESLEAKISVTGNGNLKLIEIPKLVVPNGLEQYEPEHNEHVRTNLAGMNGTISDTYTLVPQFKGKYPIQPIKFSYFDLKTETYKEITSPEIIVEVKNGPNRGDVTTSNSTSGNGTVAKQVVTQSNSQFRFIKSDTSLASQEKTYFFKTTTFWTLFALPLMAIPLFVFFGKKREARLNDVSANRIRKADKLAKKYLSEAKKSLGDQKEFYIAMEKALHNYLKAKLNIQTSEMSKEKIEGLLQEKGVELSTQGAFIKLLESCEFARYTPASTSTMQEDYDKASKVISAIDKQL